ncbi:hypothetical protein B0H13DRAFT_2352559 [Mycena leptocephala]|nr:hypothetical protein B0H13DRAFT_2352559 [Mycena leptocephala]
MPKKVEVKAVAVYNRTKVATLTEKSSSVFSIRLSPQDHKFDRTSPDELNMEDKTEPQVNLLAEIVTTIRASIIEYSGHLAREVFARKVFKPHFNAELKTLRVWHTYTSNPGMPPSF